MSGFSNLEVDKRRYDEAIRQIARKSGEVRAPAPNGCLRWFPQHHNWGLSYWVLTAALIQTGSGPHAEANPGRRVVLTVAGLGYDTAKQLRREGLEDFTQKTGIQVDFIPAWGNSADQLALTLRTLKGRFATPDIYVVDAVWPGTLHPYLLDLAPYLEGSADEQPAELLKNNTVQGRLVALPFYVNVGMLYYRTDLLRKYRYTRPPNTWDELERMAARIQSGERASGNASFWGYIFQGAAYEGLTCNALEWQMSSGGGHIIEADGTISVNNAQTAQALRKAAGWVASISPPSVLSYTESDSLNAFRSGNAAFLRYWSSGYNGINNSAIVRGRFDVAPLPSGPRGRAQTMGGFQMAVSAYSMHPHEASQLVLYLTGSHVQRRRALEEGFLPSLSRLYADPELLKYVPEIGVFRDLKPQNLVFRPSTIAGNCYADVSRIYYDGVHAILSRRQGAEEVLRAMEKQLLTISPRFHLGGK